MQALLRRGADPNLPLLQQNGNGNTVLHFACVLEKEKFIDILLEYGANSFAMNGDGLTPLQMLPGDAVRSMKLRLAQKFKEAGNKLNNADNNNSTINSNIINKHYMKQPLDL